MGSPEIGNGHSRKGDHLGPGDRREGIVPSWDVVAHHERRRWVPNRHACLVVDGTHLLSLCGKLDTRLHRNRMKIVVRSMWLVDPTCDLCRLKIKLG